MDGIYKSTVLIKAGNLPLPRNPLDTGPGQNHLRSGLYLECVLKEHKGVNLGTVMGDQCNSNAMVALVRAPTANVSTEIHRPNTRQERRDGRTDFKQETSSAAAEHHCNPSEEE
ncbi:unnamed protein product [Boreogadus saida]